MRLLRLMLLSTVVITLAVSTVEADSARLTYERAMARQRELAASTSPSLGEVRQASASFEVVVRRYPTSGYADNALLNAAELAEQAYARSGSDADRRRAQMLYTWLAREYPASPLVGRAAAAAGALETSGPELSASTAGRSVQRPATTPSPKPPPLRGDSPPAPKVEDSAPAGESGAASAPPTAQRPSGDRSVVIRDVRRAVLPELVRVTIELDDEVAYRQERLDGPPRVFFDLEGTVPSPGLQNAILTWQDDVVRQVRMGRPSATTTRVVLDLEGASRYSVFTLYSPYRLVIDVERASGKRAGVQPSVPRPTVERETKSASVAPPAAPQALEPAVPASTRPLVADLDLVPQPARPRVDPREIDGKDLGLDRDPALTSRAIDPDSGVSPASPGRAATAPTPAPELPPSPRTPAANSNGTFSLARQLGLGISRIVIDPGHGGHDPGALGKGISEANLVLDVALRLEKLLLKRPGAEVVLTRRADTFVALEERTAIANREKADLFLSIHVNASRNAKAQGVETYFLNFATSPEAEAVAARENSASGRTMHNLPDIVRAITLNNKLDESRDLARVVQDSLVKRLGAQHRQLRDLGVKQAPFVVLIGAAMPSVLAEIAFITNPREAQLLKSETYRQRIAEALLDAVTRYQRSLKSVGAVAAQ